MRCGEKSFVMNGLDILIITISRTMERQKMIQIFSIIISLFFVLLIYGHVAMAGPYLDSAHGNTGYGVLRTSLSAAPNDYAKGNCAHCHEQHASIGGSEPTPLSGSASSFCIFADNLSGVTANPYSQSDDFCFYCHCYTDASSLQTSNFTNYDHSHTFGGYSSSTPASIFAAFNQTSYHNLYDIQDFAQTNFSSFFESDSNPCVACHNPHLAKRNKENVTDPSYTAISRPTVHEGLWGDGSGEKMSDYYSGHYRAPYYSSSTSTYEPGGTSTYNGSTMPDYATFCIDCHNNTNTIYSHALGRNLKTIDWETAGGESGGDKHGKNAATVGLDIKNPFASSGLGVTIGFALSCLDCHEPHGAPNVMLIRNGVNGGTLAGNIPSFNSSNWPYLCCRCHQDDSSHGGSSYKFKYVHHLSSDSPYTLPEPNCAGCHGAGGDLWNKSQIACYECHFHGADDSYFASGLGKTATGRRTF